MRLGQGLEWLPRQSQPEGIKPLVLNSSLQVYCDAQIQVYAAAWLQLNRVELLQVYHAAQLQVNRAVLMQVHSASL
jgi:hypothetical protein